MTLAVVFPGQGSQSVGMLADLAAAFPIVGETFAEAASVLDKDLWALSQIGPAEALADTRVTQPLMFVSDIAVWRVLQQQGMPAASVMAGHSLGEFAALVAAGSLPFANGVALVQQRADLMSGAVPEGEGGMAALLGLDDDAVQTLCDQLTGDRIVEAANFNAPGQVAISGHVDALQNACATAKSDGAKRAIMLPVSVPNHSSLMRPAGEQLVAHIDAIEWQAPSTPIVQNASATVADSLEAVLISLRQHVYNPVYWTRTVTEMRDNHGVTAVVECGPGKVLAGLGKRIDRQLPHYPVESTATLEKAMEAMGADA